LKSVEIIVLTVNLLAALSYSIMSHSELELLRDHNRC
jgi:hypothetical protein